MMSRFRTISGGVLIALIPLIMLLFHNQLSNWHYHVLSNGMLVKHAHPFNKSDNPNSPVQGHKHSDFEFFVLGQLSALTLLLSLFLIFLLLKTSISGTRLFSNYEFPYLKQRFQSLQLLRAPPAGF